MNASEAGADAIQWMSERYDCPSARFYANPFGAGRVCELGIRAAGINRSAFGDTDADAANAAAILVATELGWAYKAAPAH